jgi:RNA polymerase sigma-70 factor (ECF subfamily)
MALDDLGLGVGAGQEEELCIDTRVLGLMQRTVTLEEKVGELFELLRDPVYLYLMAVLGNPAEAEDVTQETFLRLYRALHRGQSITNVRFFVFRVAHNLAFDLREKVQHSQHLDSRTWDELRDLLPDPGLNPEQRVLQMERFERLHVAMAWLSPQETQCLHLRAEGFRYREIGEILNINAKTAAEFLRRGIRKLMKDNNG